MEFTPDVRVRYVRLARDGDGRLGCPSGVNSARREAGGRTRSGRCRASSFWVTSRGSARGVASETPTMVRKASGTVQMAGSPRRTAGHPVLPTPTMVRIDGDRRRAAAEHQAAERPDPGQAAPPDPEEEEGAEGRCRDGEGPADEHVDRDAGDEDAEPGHDRPDHDGRGPEGADAATHDVVGKGAGHADQEAGRGREEGGKGSGGDQRTEQRSRGSRPTPAGAARGRPSRSAPRRRGPALPAGRVRRRRPGRRRSRRAAGGRTPSFVEPPVRPCSCRSGPECGAGPWRRGRSPAESRRWPPGDGSGSPPRCNKGEVHSLRGSTSGCCGRPVRGTPGRKDQRCPRVHGVRARREGDRPSLRRAIELADGVDDDGSRRP